MRAIPACVLPYVWAGYNIRMHRRLIYGSSIIISVLTFALKVVDEVAKPSNESTISEADKLRVLQTLSQ